MSIGLIVVLVILGLVVLVGVIFGVWVWVQYNAFVRLRNNVDESYSTMDVYMKKAQADALRDAAKNPGMAGTAMGAGMGVGMGMQMGHIFGNMAAGAAQGTANSAQTLPDTIKCPSCKAEISSKSKFCPECGYAIKTVCPACGNKVKPGTKFCPECGGKL